ncbi:hypothetical protein HRbin28_00056 [bacterium HR28]|nr:hypothetical protein HRbin28_00056 [bacterium HR28]
MAPPRRWIVILAATIALVMVACSSPAASPSPAPSAPTTTVATTATASAERPTPTVSLPTPTPASMPPTPTVAVPSPTTASQPETAPRDRWAAAWQGVRSVAIHGQAYDPSGVLLSETDLLLEKPDRLRALTSLPDGTEMEMILIGERLWLHFGGTWMEAPSGTMNELVAQAFLFEDRVLDDSGNTPTFELVGEETLDGERTQVWQAEFTQLGGRSTVWVGADDLPRRLVWEDNNGRVEVRYSRYNEPFGIQPPTS